LVQPTRALVELYVTCTCLTDIILVSSAEADLKIYAKEGGVGSGIFGENFFQKTLLILRLG